MSNQDPSAFWFQTEEDARHVLEAMQEIIKQYAFVSIGDFLDLISLPSTYQDTRRGWVDLENVKIEKASDGFRIKFPESQGI